MDDSKLVRMRIVPSQLDQHIRHVPIQTAVSVFSASIQKSFLIYPVVLEYAPWE